MGYLLDKVDQAELANQQDVVRNERRQSYENRPYGMAEEAMSTCSFPRRIRTTRRSSARTPTSRPRSSTTCRQFFKQLLRAEQREPRDRRRHRYRRGEALVEKYFGTLKRGAAVPPIMVDDAAITSERREVVTDASSCRASTWRGSRRRFSSRATRTPTLRRTSSAADAQPALQAARLREADCPGRRVVAVPR